MSGFLLLSIRAEPAAADDEHRAFARFLGLPGVEQLERRLLGVEDVEDVIDDPRRWRGVLLGGGSFTYSDDVESKSPAQQRAEHDLARLLDVVVAADLPFLGACYGIGTLGAHRGGLIDTQYPEPVGPLAVTLTEEGAADPLLAGLPRDFAAYGGHKEACSKLPPDAVLLATSTACPVQAFRVGEHVYAFQFHPELDLAGLLTRIETYATYGYFDPDTADDLRTAGRAVEVAHPMRILANFAARYGDTG